MVARGRLLDRPTPRPCTPGRKQAASPRRTIRVIVAMATNIPGDVSAASARGAVISRRPRSSASGVDVGVMRSTVSPLRLPLPHQRTFIAFDRKQIAERFSFTLLLLFVRQSGSVVRLGVDLSVERGYSAHL